MTPEETPFRGEHEPTKAPLKGPNVTSTLERPPHPDAVKAHDAVIRKHLRERSPREQQRDEE
jgi:hypothetical protein